MLQKLNDSRKGFERRSINMMKEAMENVEFPGKAVFLEDIRANRGFLFALPENVMPMFLDIISNLRLLHPSMMSFEYEINSMNIYDQLKDYGISLEFRGLPVPLFNLNSFSNPMKSCYLMKPNGLEVEGLKLNANALSGSRIDRVIPFPHGLPDSIFNSLYPNCLTRPYGNFWRTYLRGPCVAFIVACDGIMNLRQKAVHARELSNRAWTGN